MFDKATVTCRLLLACAAVLTVNVSALAAEPVSLLGTWKIVQFQDDGSVKFGRLGISAAAKNKPERIANLIVSKDEIYVVRGDGQRDVLAGLTNCAWKSYTLDEQADPKQIDIVGVPGKDGKPHNYLGIYSLEGGQLSLCWNETPRGSDPAKIRPTKLASDGEMNLLVCERLATQSGAGIP